MRQDSLEGWEGHSEQGTACAKSSFGHDGFSAKGHSSCLSAPLSSPSNHLPFGPVRPGGDSHPGRSLALVGFVQLRPQLCKHPLLKLSPAVPLLSVSCAPHQDPDLHGSQPWFIYTTMRKNWQSTHTGHLCHLI